jgi:uncharacterized protein (TIGR02466 family)
MPVELWFSVPFLIHDVEPSVREATHAKVSAYLATDRARKDVPPAPAESVETSYYNEKLSVLEDADLFELKDTVLRAGSSFMEGMGLPPVRLAFERAWINVFRPGAQEAQHSHDGSLLSCTYYVEAPENCGDLVFPDPVGARRAHRAFTKTSGTNPLTMPDVGFKPQAGRLIMFESWVPHSIQCNKSDQVRISLAFNLRKAPDSAR